MVTKAEEDSPTYHLQLSRILKNNNDREEIIEIMGNQVLAVIVKELQQSKYISLSIDSTPDISHIDQLAIVVRYIRMSDGEVVERFFTFIPIESHTGEALATTVLKFLNEWDIDIKNLRGQHVGLLQRSSGTHLSNQSTCTLYSLRSTFVKLGWRFCCRNLR